MAIHDASAKFPPQFATRNIFRSPLSARTARGRYARVVRRGGDKLYVMTRSDMGKIKRIRNNPQVRVAPCTIRGKVTGPELLRIARILPPAEHAQRGKR